MILAQVSRGIELVYGGGSVGLMGLIAQTVLDGGCGVLGLEISAHALFIFTNGTVWINL